MGEARRKADEQLAGLESAGSPCERAREAISEILEQLSENYREFELAVSERVEVSKKAMAQWRKETRELVARLAHVRSEPA